MTTAANATALFADDTTEILTSSEVMGISFSFAFAILSMLALAVVALRAVYLAISSLIRERKSSSREHVFFRTQLGIYIACLLTSNALNSAAGIVLGFFISERSIPTGAMCTAQAIAMSVGNFGSAFFTVAIAIHTFSSLVLCNRLSAWVTIFFATLGWTMSLAVGFVPVLINGLDNGIYGPSGFSCAIRPEFPLLDFVLHLLPIFAASLISAILYSLIFLVLRGTLTFTGGIRFNLDPNQRLSARFGTSTNEEYQRFISAIARSMLWYPAVYISLLLPYSISRLLNISGFPVAFGIDVFAYCSTFALGLANVLLLYNTFRVLGPAFGGSNTISPQKKADDVESMGNTEKKTPSPSSAFDASTAFLETPAPSYQSWNSNSSRMISSAHKDDLSGSFDTEADKPVRRSASINSGSYSVQRPITPVDELNRMLESPGLSRPPSQAGSSNSNLRPFLLNSQARSITGQQYQQHHAREHSTDSTTSLPPPPRASRSPSPIARRPTLEAFLRPSPLDRRPTIKEVAYYDVPAPQPPQRSDSLMVSPGYLTHNTNSPAPAVAGPPSPSMYSPTSEYGPTEAATPVTPHYYPSRTRSSKVSQVAAGQYVIPPTPASARSQLRSTRSIPSIHGPRDMPPSNVHRQSSLFYQ